MLPNTNCYMIFYPDMVVKREDLKEGSGRKKMRERKLERDREGLGVTVVITTQFPISTTVFDRLSNAKQASFPW